MVADGAADLSRIKPVPLATRLLALPEMPRDLRGKQYVDVRLVRPVTTGDALYTGWRISDQIRVEQTGSSSAQLVFSDKVSEYAPTVEPTRPTGSTWWKRWCHWTPGWST
jgi:hypothetical protein